MLNRMVELATQSSNGTYGEQERGKLQDEVNALRDEIDRISEGTNFNGIDLLNGKMDGTGKIDSTTVDLSTTGKINQFDFTAKTGNENIKIKFEAVQGNAGDGKATAEATAAGDTLTIKLNMGKNATLTEADINKAISDYLGDNGTSQTIKDTFKDIEVSLSGYITTGADASAADTSANASAASKATGSALSLQVGDTNENFQKVNVNVESMSAKSLGLDAIDISTQEGAGNAIEIINAAIEKVSTARSDLGAIQNRLDHTINNLGVTTENMTAAESRIRDVDMAEEMMQFTKNNILTQASQAMLAQANQLPQGVLQLLQ